MSLRTLAAFVLTATLAGQATAARAPATQGPAAQGELRWGGDAEGGYPYVEADPADPSGVVGFEVDIATLVASKLTSSSLTLTWTPAKDNKGVTAYRIFQDGVVVAMVSGTVLGFDVSDWSALGQHRGQLLSFIRPRDLPA